MTTLAQNETTSVVVGVDTHKDVHVAVAIDCVGRRLGELAIETTAAGFLALARWAATLGDPIRFGIEGTGSYGAGLARFLLDRGHHVEEINRPQRQLRHRKGKSDTLDAESAARQVLAGQSCTPKRGNHHVEMIRNLRVARSTAMKARTQSVNALKATLVTAPVDVREQLAPLTTRHLVDSCARMQPTGCVTVTDAVNMTLRSLARRYEHLSDEIDTLSEQLADLTKLAAPQLLELVGVGPEVAGALLVAVGDNPERIRNESAFAHLCGVAPIPASSGKTSRHRLNRNGDRQANAALYRIALVRLRHDEQTQKYMQRRLQEGKTKPEIIRCLKRYIAREIHTHLNPTNKPPKPLDKQ